VCPQGELQSVRELAELVEADRRRRASQAMRLLGRVRQVARLEPAPDPLDASRRVEREQVPQLVAQ